MSPSTKSLTKLGRQYALDELIMESHARYADLCEDVLFVDIDYPELMRKKRSVVQETPQLRGILGKDFVINDSDGDHVMLRSELYCQIGCDLREVDKLGVLLEELTPLCECPVLFVAEVSITYMDTQFADALIQWASKIGN
ncbi:tRNA methyltransferase ppm2, partial [Claviceps lovelessii]